MLELLITELELMLEELLKHTKMLSDTSTTEETSTSETSTDMLTTTSELGLTEETHITELIMLKLEDGTTGETTTSKLGENIIQTL